MSASQPPAAVIVLAAGEGTRMRSRSPKVMHKMLGRTLLGHVMAAVEPLQPAKTVVVVGHGRDEVNHHLGQIAPTASSVVQEQQLGTGHAVGVALADVAPAGADTAGTVVVVCGDTPLLTTATLRDLVDEHTASSAAATVLTAKLADPSGYGRVLRDASGAVNAIVEHADADIEQRRVGEVNSGIYAFDLTALRQTLSGLTRENSQGEEYLPDVVALMRAKGLTAAAVLVDDSQEILGVNDRAQLADVRNALRDRVNREWMLAGVSIIDPTSTMIGVGARLEPDSTIHPWTLIEGTTTVASGAEVGPGCQLIDTDVGPDAIVRFTLADSVTIGAGASVGPYTYLRPGTTLAAGTRAGAFVEAKNAIVGPGSKIPHLSYVGDAEIGEDSNIGAATIFVNYDGVNKHRTVIGDSVRIGSDTMLVAPVEIGDGAYTAAGSVITDDVPPGAMAVGRAKQRTILGWVARKRAGTRSAAAAAAAEAAARNRPVDNGRTAPTANPGEPEAEGSQ